MNYWYSHKTDLVMDAFIVKFYFWSAIYCKHNLLPILSHWHCIRNYNVTHYIAIAVGTSRCSSLIYGVKSVQTTCFDSISKLCYFIESRLKRINNKLVLENIVLNFAHYMFHLRRFRLNTNKLQALIQFPQRPCSSQTEFADKLKSHNWEISIIFPQSWLLLLVKRI